MSYSKFTISLLTFSFLLAIPTAVSAGVLTQPSNNLGLVGYWSMNEGTGSQAGDFSGNGNDGTLEGDPQWTDGRHGQALDFDGEDDRISLSNILQFDGEFTVAYWLKPDRSDGYRVINGQDYANSIWHLDSTTIRLDNRQVGGGTVDITLPNSIRANEWAHVVVVRNLSNDVSVYVNGDKSSSSVSWQDYLELYNIGYKTDNTSWDPYSGFVDEPRIYNRALGQSEIQDLYERGSVKIKQPDCTNLEAHWRFDEGRGQRAGDSSFNTNTGTLGSTTAADAADPSWVVPSSDGTAGGGPSGHALDFDGEDDYVSLPTELISKNGSLAFWAKADWENLDNGEVRMLGTQDSTGDSFRTYNSNRINLHIDTTEVGNESVSAFDSVDSNTWIFACYTWVYDSDTNETILKGYGDAQFFEENVISGYARSMDQRIDLGYWAGNYFPGTIDDVRIYDQALTEDEIKELYESTQHKVNASQNQKLTDGLVGMWSFNGQDLTTATATDVSGNANDGTLQNDPQPTIGKVGQALEFDGEDDYVETPITNEDLVGVDGEGTISFWFQPLVPQEDQSKNRIIMSVDGISTTGERSWDFRWGEDQNDDLKFWGQISDTLNIGSFTASGLNVGEWHFVTLVYEENGPIEYYINTNLEGSDTIDTFDDIDVPLHLVARDGGGNGEECSLDDIRIYDRALSEKEIQRLYNMGR